jgi:hypothetical protein
MERRRFLALTGTALGTASLGFAFQRSAARSRPDQAFDDDPDERSSVAPAKTSTTTAEPRPAPQLELVSTAPRDLTVGLRLTRFDDLTTIVNRDRELSYGERVFLSGLLDRDTDYLFDLDVENEPVLQRRLRAGERLVLGIRDPKTVEIVEYKRVTTR